MNTLSRSELKNIGSQLSLPPDSVFELPEKVLQFGTGVLLRALPDYFIDEANRRGVFNGRVVVVKTTAKGDTSHFDEQDNLFTICVRGIESGNEVSRNTINSSISRVLTAQKQWDQILACAENPLMKIVISNTTEVGIQLTNEDIRSGVPVSFPGKLLAFLFARYTCFKGSADSGLVILPTELIPENGAKLKAILLELASYNQLDQTFLQWLNTSNHFCNTLVDRIVPGMPNGQRKMALQNELGYEDNLLIVAEAYRLWAIEGNDYVKSVLTFSTLDAGVIIADDITLYRELKLRLLNATHTLSCSVAFLSGITTVVQAMNHPVLSAFIRDLMLDEIAKAIPYEIPPDTSRAFGLNVLDRFRNPEIEHPWINITVQYTSKMRMRCVPLLQTFYSKYKTIPPYISFGFASYILFMRIVRVEGNSYYGSFNEMEYLVQDDYASSLHSLWISHDHDTIAETVLSSEHLWNTDLTTIPGFAEEVKRYIHHILMEGLPQGIAKLSPTKISF